MFRAPTVAGKFSIFFSILLGMQFELQGRIVFEAEDIPDAFRRLAAHFTALADDQESDLPLIGTDVKVRELGAKTPVPPVAGKRTTFRGQRKS
jgi:hypothetical protein